MGFFSFFCGLIYNDFTSIPLKIFGDSCYNVPLGHHSHTDEEDTTPKVHGEVTIKSSECIYPIGVDPSWYLGKNELTYMNSLKMKISVIFGVAQMALGVCMKGLNSIYHGKKMDFVFECIPQIVLLMALFGFMDMLIIVKWLTDWENQTGDKPPSIISTMISMCLNMGEPPADPTMREAPLIPN